MLKYISCISIHDYYRQCTSPSDCLGFLVVVIVVCSVAFVSCSAVAVCGNESSQACRCLNTIEFSSLPFLAMDTTPARSRSPPRTTPGMEGGKVGKGGRGGKGKDDKGKGDNDKGKGGKGKGEDDDEAWGPWR